MRCLLRTKQALVAQGESELRRQLRKGGWPGERALVWVGGDKARPGSRTGIAGSEVAASLWTGTQVT